MHIIAAGGFRVEQTPNRIDRRVLALSPTSIDCWENTSTADDSIGFRTLNDQMTFGPTVTDESRWIRKSVCGSLLDIEHLGDRPGSGFASQSVEGNHWSWW
ncbi:hypothetical protein [Halocatena marina]|uniref:Uncharacterized protein n=1 Tax=Halocatena marina TaxID=2934937 RepID=A0ABD5YTP3_9EURY|nr:hypothetical protein [Halocatena marina]